jgi:hypothetical protein
MVVQLANLGLGLTFIFAYCTDLGDKLGLILWSFLIGRNVLDFTLGDAHLSLILFHSLLNLTHNILLLSYSRLVI